MSPCFNCQKRHATCHPSCKDYLEYRVQIDLINQKKEKEHVLINISRIIRKQKQRDGYTRYIARMSR